jgi:hypothetical protein
MAGLDSRRQKLKAHFIEARGYWSELWDGVLQLSPEFFEAYSLFSSIPWKHGTLPPKIKELIYVAIDASTTHLYTPGTRRFSSTSFARRVEEARSRTAR